MSGTNYPLIELRPEEIGPKIYNIIKNDLKGCIIMRHSITEKYITIDSIYEKPTKDLKHMKDPYGDSSDPGEWETIFSLNNVQKKEEETIITNNNYNTEYNCDCGATIIFPSAERETKDNRLTWFISSRTKCPNCMQKWIARIMKAI